MLGPPPPIARLYEELSSTEISPPARLEFKAGTAGPVHWGGFRVCMRQKGRYFPEMGRTTFLPPRAMLYKK